MSTSHNTMLIPFNRPFVSGNEYGYMKEAIANGHISGNGPFTCRCQDLLERSLGVKRALLTTSCTDALEMAALLLRIGQGDEVIMPSFTFVSTANAFVLRGGRPVFADIRPDTLNLDESQLPFLITRRTKVIVVVHYGGVGCEMDAILRVAERHGVAVIEDNAHGLFGAYRGKPLGTLGCLATLSFHETKNISCGEGGALLINEPSLIERAEVLRDKGTDRSRFLRGQVDKYSWVDVGSSFLPSDLVAAFLFAQLEFREEILCRRRRIWQYYFQNLIKWAVDRDTVLPVVPDHCEQSYHMFYLVLPTRTARDGLIDHLRSRGIMSVFHYVPLHLSLMGRSLGGGASCPVSESISNRLLRLPFYNGMTESEQSDVIAAIKSFENWPAGHDE